MECSGAQVWWVPLFFDCVTIKSSLFQQNGRMVSQRRRATRILLRGIEPLSRIILLEKCFDWAAC